MLLTLDPHPLLDAVAFTSTWPGPLGGLDAPSLRTFFAPGAAAPLQADDVVRAAVRELLRQGGFKPTGRSKPASEYLVKAVEEGWLSPARGINACVDACNAVSLHSGLPISVVDLDLARPPLRLATCPPGTRYVFNPSGQEIDLGGLICLWDAEGPCGGPVKDSQRTKTHEGTTRTLTVIWGSAALPGRTQAAWEWHDTLLRGLGVDSERVACVPPPAG